MATTTKLAVRQQLIYSVFVRNHTKAGTFQALEADLPRIKALGTDYVWLLPIHPIGVAKRKGDLGSPYAIKDYRAINPEYGSMADFEHLVDAIHAQGMKVMLDVVYNHTSPDSVLATSHPEWFYQNADGSLRNKVGDWSDVADLDYRQHDLWAYQIDTLTYWAQFVDGYRCDVAPLVPTTFWKAARDAVAQVKPDFLWLAESAGDDFIAELRHQGYFAASDGEIFNAFDISYDYDVYGLWQDVINGKAPLRDYVAALTHQDVAFPANYAKLRFLENHDQERAHGQIENIAQLKAWLAFSYFERGTTLLYAGEEFGLRHTPSLFTKDTLATTPEVDLTTYLQTLQPLLRHPLREADDYQLTSAGHDDVLVVSYTRDDHALIGIFPVMGQAANVPVALADGDYRDLLSGQTVAVVDGMVGVHATSMVLES
ncbi:alpha-amylase family glycosyl hydrolase [Lacticaseibacillus saniviri]